MSKKTSDDVKKHIVFFIDFSSIFREKSTENRAKSVETSFVHKNRRKSTFETPFFNKKTIFSEFLGSPRVPRGVPGRPGNVPASDIFLTLCSIAPENVPGRPPKGPREATEVLPGAPRIPFWADFWIDFAHRKQTEKCQKCQRNLAKALKN